MTIWEIIAIILGVIAVLGLVAVIMALIGSQL